MFFRFVRCDFVLLQPKGRGLCFPQDVTAGRGWNQCVGAGVKTVPKHRHLYSWLCRIAEELRGCRCGRRSGIIGGCRPDRVLPQQLARFSADDVAIVRAAPECAVVLGDQIRAVMLQPEFPGTLAK